MKIPYTYAIDKVISSKIREITDGNDTHIFDDQVDEKTDDECNICNPRNIADYPTNYPNI